MSTEPSGEIINPEIKLIDDEGNEYLFTHYGAAGTETSRYVHRGPLPTNRIYKKLLIRSDFPIKAKKILWSGFDVKDLK